MGLLNTEIETRCSSCKKYFTVKVDSFLGMVIDNPFANYKIIYKRCPHCGFYGMIKIIYE